MATHPGVRLVSATKPAKKPASATGTWKATTAPKPVTAAPKVAASRISGTGHATAVTMTQRTASGGTALFVMGPGGRWQLAAVQADRPRLSIPSGSGGSGGSSGQLVASADYSQHPGGGVTTGGGSDSPRLNTGPNLYTNPGPISAEPGYKVEAGQPGVFGGTITGPGFSGIGFNDISPPFTVTQPGTGLSVTLPPDLLTPISAFFDPGIDPGSMAAGVGGWGVPGVMVTRDQYGNVTAGGYSPSDLNIGGWPGDTVIGGSDGASSSAGFPANFGDTTAGQSGLF